MACVLDRGSVGPDFIHAGCCGRSAGGLKVRHIATEMFRMIGYISEQAGGGSCRRVTLRRSHESQGSKGILFITVGQLGVGAYLVGPKVLARAAADFSFAAAEKRVQGCAGSACWLTHLGATTFIHGHHHESGHTLNLSTACELYHPEPHAPHMAHTQLRLVNTITLDTIL